MALSWPTLQASAKAALVFAITAAAGHSSTQSDEALLTALAALDSSVKLDGKLLSKSNSSVKMKRQLQKEGSQSSKCLTGFLLYTSEGLRLLPLLALALANAALFNSRCGAKGKADRSGSSSKEGPANWTETLRQNRFCVCQIETPI